MPGRQLLGVVGGHDMTHLDSTLMTHDLIFLIIPLARPGIRGTEREERSKTQERHGFLTTGQI